MDADIGWLAWYIEANLRVRITGLDFVYCPAEEVVVGARCGAERGGSVGSGVRRRGSLQWREDPEQCSDWLVEVGAEVYTVFAGLATEC